MFLLIFFVAVLSEANNQKSDEKLLQQIKEILKKVPLIDGHNDLAWVIRNQLKGRVDQVNLRLDTRKLPLETPMMTDIPRLKQGLLGAQFWSAYIPVQVTGTEAIQAALEQIDIIHNFCEQYPDVFEMAYTSADIQRIHRAGKIGCLIGVEGGHVIHDSIPVLRDLYRMGARYLTLTHTKNTEWADSATAAPEHSGLTDLGRQIVLEMNRLGMLVDLSHVSPDTMRDVLDITKAPVIFSHSSVRSYTDFPRNVPEDILKRMPQNNGVVMINFATGFISYKALQYRAVKEGEEKRLSTLYPEDPERVKRELKLWQEKNPDPRATIQQVADHIDAVRKIAGVDSIGIGSDFDGITSTPIGLEDVSTYPALFVELLKRGYTNNDVAKIAGLNVLRVMKQCEAISEKLKKETSPSQTDLPKLKTE